MPTPSLPAEILDIIFDQIQSKSSLPTREFILRSSIYDSADVKYSLIASSQRILASLALTSKQFLPHARIYLYSRPLVEPSSFTWAKAISLADTILTNNGLARLVKSLEGIAPGMFQLAKLDAPSKPLPYQIRGCTRDFSWYLAVLGACTNLFEVDIYFKAQHQLTKIDRALQPAISTFTTANFIGFPGYQLSHDRLTSSCVKDALQRDSFENVQFVKMDYIEFLRSTRINHPIQTLTITSCRSWDLHGFELLDLSHFHTLELDYLYNGYQELLKSVAPALRHLVFHNWGSACKPSFECYGRDLPWMSPPVELSLLVNLKSISFTNMGSTWTAFLEILSSSSPLLDTINLHGSRWFPSEHWRFMHLSLEDRFGPTCPEPKLKNVLTSFKHLKEVDLGVLPTTDQQAYESVRTELEERGVSVTWECCREGLWCATCKKYHF